MLSSPQKHRLPANVCKCEKKVCLTPTHAHNIYARSTRGNTNDSVTSYRSCQLPLASAVVRASCSHTHSHTLGISITESSSSSPHLETSKTLNNPRRASHDSAALWALGRRRSPAQPNAPDRATFSLAGGALSPEHCTAATILAQRQAARAGTERRRRPTAAARTQQRSTREHNPGSKSTVVVCTSYTTPIHPHTHTAARTHTHATQQSSARPRGGEKVR